VNDNITYQYVCACLPKLQRRQDASGNVMSEYLGGTTPHQQPIYGSSRLGLYKGQRTEGVRTVGAKQYELTNHLGNVLTVVKDNIHLQGTDTWAHVEFAMDYYAFGGEMPGRKNTTKNYRYGFNGKEKDTESQWGDTSYDYGFRIYNPRYARFLSVDPLTKSYPMLTPYQFASNRPIDGVDLDGLEYLRADEARVEIVLGTAFIKLENFSKLYQSQFRKEFPHYGLIFQKSDGIGYGDGELGQVFVPHAGDRMDARLSNKVNDPTYQPTELKLEPQARADRRRHKREGTPTLTTGRVPGSAGKSVFILNVLNYAAEAYAINVLSNDRNELTWQTKDWEYRINNWPFKDIVNENISPLTKALNDVKRALDINLIPDEFQNVRDMSLITNIVLFGGTGKESKGIRKVGERIINEISGTGASSYRGTSSNNERIYEKDR
jgi:RHS repeat-associated protein